MGKITVIRNHQFYGVFALTWVAVNMSEEDARTCARLVKKTKKPFSNFIPILSGQTITIDIAESKASLFVVAFQDSFSRKALYSNKISIDESFTTKAYELKLIRPQKFGGELVLELYEQPAQANQANDTPLLIKQLAELRDSGALTDEEFQAKKADLLKRI